MSNKRINKAYIRYDGNGRVIPGALLLNRFKPTGGGKWHEIPAYECCNSVPAPQALRLTFDSIESANLLVGDASSVTDWNTFFDLPTYGNPFTSVVVVGNEVQLFGGSNITLREGLMSGTSGGTSLISFIDEANCIVDSEGYPFYGQYELTTIILPSLATIIDGEFCYECYLLATLELNSLISITGTSSFDSCESLTTINLPLLQYCDSATFMTCTSLTEISLPACTNLGASVGYNDVFVNITGNNITLTVPSALMTCNSGNPDGDIQYLQANNTVTVITV